MTTNKQTNNRQNSNLYFWTTATLQLLQLDVFPYFHDFKFLKPRTYQHLRRRHISNLHISMLVFHISRSYSFVFHIFATPVVLALVVAPYFMTSDTFYWERPADRAPFAGTLRVQALVFNLCLFIHYFSYGFLCISS